MKPFIAKSVGDLEYVDCTSEERRDLSSESPGNDSKLPLMVRLQSWIVGECGISLNYYWFLVHSDPEWLYQLKSKLVR